MNAEKINRLLATEVMGWKYVEAYVPSYVIDYEKQLLVHVVNWNPLRFVSQAMMVAERIKKDKEISNHIEICIVIETNNLHEVVINTFDGIDGWSRIAEETSKSLCEAICLAVLKAKGITELL